MDSPRVLVTTMGSRVTAPLSTVAAQEASFREPPPASAATSPILDPLHLTIVLVLLLLALLLVYVSPRIHQTLQRRSAARRRAESMAKLEKQFRNTQIHVANSIVAVNGFVAKGRIKHARQHFASNVENTTRKWNKTRERVLRTFHVKFPGELIPEFLATDSTIPDFPSPPRGSPSGATSPARSFSSKAAAQQPLQATPSTNLPPSPSVRPHSHPMPPISREKTAPLNPARSLDTSSSAVDASLATPSLATTSLDTPVSVPSFARVKQQLASDNGQVIEKGCTVEVLKISTRGSRLVKVVNSGQLLTLPAACLETVVDLETFKHAHEGRPVDPSLQAGGFPSGANTTHERSADDIQARPVSPSFEAGGFPSEALESRKRSNEQLDGRSRVDQGHQKRAKRRRISTEDIIARAKEKGSHLWQPKILLNCAACVVTKARRCDKPSPSEPCSWCVNHDFECVCLPRIMVPISACDRCYGDPMVHRTCVLGVESDDCQLCATQHLECTWVVRDYTRRRRTELYAERDVWKQRVLSRKKECEDESEDDSPAPSPRPKRKRNEVSYTGQSGVLSDTTDDYQPTDDNHNKGKRQKQTSPAQSATVSDRKRRSSTRPPASSSCAHSTDTTCVLHRIKQASDESELFAKYIQLCRAAGDLCIPSAIISNFGASLTCLIQRDSGLTKDDLSGLWLSLPRCNDHKSRGKLSDDHEHISFPIAAALLQHEQQYGEDSSSKAVDHYIERTPAVSPLGKICHQKTCVQYSHIAWKLLTCHRRSEMQELRHSASPVIPETCEKGCLPRQAVKTSKQLIIEAFCLINHIEDPFNSSLWSDEMVGEGVQSDAPEFFSASISRDDFIMLTFTKKGRVTERPLAHIINKISSLNATARRDISSDTVDNQYALFEVGYFPETPFFALEAPEGEEISDVNDEVIEDDAAGDDVASRGSNVPGEDDQVSEEDDHSDGSGE